MKDDNTAARTAADSLRAIEAWAKGTFIAAIVAASFAGMVAAGVACAGYEYLRLRGAAVQARDVFAKGVAEWRADVIKDRDELLRDMKKTRPVTTSVSARGSVPTRGAP